VYVEFFNAGAVGMIVGQVRLSMSSSVHAYLNIDVLNKDPWWLVPLATSTLQMCKNVYGCRVVGSAGSDEKVGAAI